MKYSAKSILIGRKPRGNNLYKTAFVKLFESENPFSSDVLPKDELEFENIREVRIKDFEISYLLEGNDIFIEKIDSFTIKEDKEKNILYVLK